MSSFTYTKFGDKRVIQRKYEAGTLIHGPNGDLIINESCTVEIEQEYAEWSSSKGGYWRDAVPEAEKIVAYLGRLEDENVNKFLESNVVDRPRPSLWSRFWAWLFRKQPIPQARLLP